MWGSKYSQDSSPVAVGGHILPGSSHKLYVALGGGGGGVMQESQVAGGDQGAAMHHLPAYKGETGLPACLPSRNFLPVASGVISELSAQQKRSIVIN